jgi:predicted peroxiredoxin
MAVAFADCGIFDRKKNVNRGNAGHIMLNLGYKVIKHMMRDVLRMGVKAKRG